MRLLNNDDIFIEASKRMNLNLGSANLNLDENILLTFNNFLFSIQQEILQSMIFTNNGNELKLKQAKIRLLQEIILYINLQIEKIRKQKLDKNLKTKTELNFEPEKAVSEFINQIQQLKKDAQQKEKSTIS
ncbi:MAG: hypothetical protein ABIL76_06795 [candidate division WOR-3 bacterium]